MIMYTSALDVGALASIATGRAASLFEQDIAKSVGVLRERIAGRRLLVIGGAGSIGSATVQALLPFEPQALHVVDQSENSLAELVRDLRSRPGGLAVGDFRALPLDYGAPVMRRFLAEEGPYDLVLNFAALKHVRSEKDVYSLIQMLDTNLVKQRRFLEWLGEMGWPARYFAVSTDKAANPVNLMGASKRLMEVLMFSTRPRSLAAMSSARFANVAFSDGSLLHGFLRRLEKHQPLAVPGGTRRYFVSLTEAGQICLLASAVADDGVILVPRLDPDKDQKELEGVAATLLERAGFIPKRCRNEAEARDMLDARGAIRQYPLLVTPLDTAGEKPYEEFVGDGDLRTDCPFDALAAIRCVPSPAQEIGHLIGEIERFVRSGEAGAGKDDLVTLIQRAIPQFVHSESGRHLDARM